MSPMLVPHLGSSSSQLGAHSHNHGSVALTPIPLLGLAIDFPESKLYWISSGNHTINRCNLDGSELEVIDTMRSQLGKATALAIMGEGLGGKKDGSKAG